jgi:hypothetical protein
MTDYRPGIISGLISGAVWAALISVIAALAIVLSYPQTLAYYSLQNSTVLNGMTPANFIVYSLEFDIALSFGAGIGFGALIGLFFVWSAPKFLGKQSYMVKGAVIAIFFWLLYELGLAGFIDIIDILSSLGASLFSGYFLGYLYQRFTGPPNMIPQGESLGSSTRNPRNPRSPGSQP